MRLRFTKSFEGEYKKITKGNTALDKKIRKQLSLIQDDINHPSLRLHKVGSYWSISVDKSIRILIAIEAQWIAIYHVGKHEDMY